MNKNFTGSVVQAGMRSAETFYSKLFILSYLLVFDCQFNVLQLGKKNWTNISEVY